MFADSLEYFSSRNFIEGIRGVHIHRNLVRILPKLLKHLAEALHKNVRPCRDNCAHLVGQRVVRCELQSLFK
jgi:hypothetical protein